jgi:perosamine synthetase
MEKISIPWAKPSFDSNELNEVIDSFSSNWLTMGPKVNKFEKEMAHLLSVPFAIAVNNGTIALDIALKSIRIKPSDEVIVPAMTYFATASAVSYQYATPVFVDIDKESFNLDPKRIEDAISKKNMV